MQSIDIIQLLKNYNIPYNKKNIKDNVIIIPDGIIKIKNFQTIKNNDDIDQLITQINKLISTYSNTIYIYIYNEDERYNMFINYINTKIDLSKVIITTSVNNINIGEFYYIIKSPGAIWTFISNYNYYFPIFSNFKILCYMDVYKRAICIMNDYELQLLNSYNFEIINDIEILEKNLCVITQNTFQERSLFTYIIKYEPLPGVKRTPCRIINGLTDLCSICNNIIYIDKHKCQILS